MTAYGSGQSTWTRRLVPDHHSVCLCVVCFLFLWCVIKYNSKVLEILSVYTFFYLVVYNACCCQSKADHTYICKHIDFRGAHDNELRPIRRYDVDLK